MMYRVAMGVRGPALLHNRQSCLEACERVADACFEHRFKDLAELGSHVDAMIRARPCLDTFLFSGDLPSGYRELTHEERMQADSAYAAYVRFNDSRKRF